MPDMSADMMSKLATPEMMDTMQRMMKGMDPAALAGMMKQSGMDVTPEQAASMQQQARTFRACVLSMPPPPHGACVPCLMTHQSPAPYVLQ